MPRRLTPSAEADLAPLAGLVIVELATYVAGPSAGMTLAQLGADVIRIDPLGGAVDVSRWPLDSNGHSLYWSSLNRGKRSVMVDLRSDAGRDLVLRLICAPGADRGIFLDNAVGLDWLASAELVKRRRDVIHLHIEGHRGGRPAVDYTVNAEAGVPLITGPPGHAAPVNHALPAWDLLTGMSAVTSILAALRRRDRTGRGARIDLALADVALAGVANFGWLSDVAMTGHDRDRQGNDIYGSFGRDFATADGRSVMVVAMTPRQWQSLVGVTGTTADIAALAAEHDADLGRDESARYRLRDSISGILAPWFAARDLDTVAGELTTARVLWAAYRTFREVAAALPGPLHRIEQPGIGSVISAESPARWHDFAPTVTPAPALGADTLTVLGELAGADRAELDDLVAAGVITAGAGND